MRKEKYYECLRLAIDWGLSKDSIAWIRTLNKIKESNGSYSLEVLEETRSNLLLRKNDYLEAWFDPIYDQTENKTHFFDLEMPSEEIWRLMVCLNRGIFAQENGGDPLIKFLVTIPSTIPGEGPLYLSPNIDGWGVKVRSSIL
ncbi:hypothetical protein [Okeania sp. KiyG1]|uniref:hypothetical protein n=1 Tax=Okeania sp. KiyG1 TaxID=2720165 RepID=UPI001923134D|nr:hypothetical protein [Okeania sp. KiyG1]GGA02161.1 hypothetical protein CYANOKiyG1_14140 [Okeania sp. KiyG1]